MGDQIDILAYRLLEEYRRLSREGALCRVASEELRRALGVDRQQLVAASRLLQEKGCIVVRRQWYAPDVVELTGKRFPLPKRLLKPKEAAAVLGVSTKTLARWEAEGRIEVIKTYGGHRRYRGDDVKRLAEQMRPQEVPNEVEEERRPDVRSEAAKSAELSPELMELIRTAGQLAEAVLRLVAQYQ
jgi:excisionase family DNA binding protein